MRLGTYLKNGSACLGTVVDDWMVDLEGVYEYSNDPGAEIPVLFNDMLSFLQHMDRNYPAAAEVIRTVEKMSPGDIRMLVQRNILTPLEDVSYLAPILNPGKLICVGLNYPSFDQSSESQASDYPVLFHKVATSLVGHQGAVVYPRNAKQLAYEGELAIVMGKHAKNIDRENAHIYIAGYTVANDIGSPDLQARTSQWTTGKMSDTFCPLGPYIVTCDEIHDPNKLRIKTTLNGEIVQDGNSSEMIFNITYLVSYLSSLVTLEPGDVILTGSPKRCGEKPDPRKRMVPGDTITVSIEKLGDLSNHIIEEV